MKIKKVKGNTFCIDTGMTYIPFYKINNEEIIMLDSGWAEVEQKGIAELLEKNNFKVIGIICSHVHIDHTGNITYLKNKYNSIIAMTAYDALVCSSPITLKTYYNNQTLSDVKKYFGHMVCKADIMLSDDEDSVSIHNINFKIFHTPGHSPKHICIVTPDNVAYLGDALISYEVMKEAKLPYAFILKEDLKSKKKLYNLKYNKYIVAHKGIYTNIQKLITDNINCYKNTASKVYKSIDNSMTMGDIIKTITKDWNINTKSINKYIAMKETIQSYVEYLNETGMIKLVIEDGFLKYTKSREGLSKAQ